MTPRRTEAAFATGAEVGAAASAITTTISTATGATIASVNTGFGALMGNEKAYQALELANRTLDKSEKTLSEALLYAGGIAIHSGIKQIMSTWAHDIAVKIVSGNAGEGAAFEVRNMEKIATDALTNSLGLFIEQLGQGMWGKQFNLCDFDPNLQLKIGLGLTQGFYTGEPVNCTWDELTSNFEELSEKEIGDVFQASVDPYSSEAGAFLNLSGLGLEEAEKKINAAAGEYTAKGGWLDFREISGLTQTPAQTAKDLQAAGFKGSLDVMGQMSGDVLADAATVFTNTLLGELIKKLLTKQIDPKYTPPQGPNPGSPGGSLASYEGEAISSGVQGAEAYYSSVRDLAFVESGSMDILLDLVSTCRDADKWKCKTNANTINEKFRSAIDQQLTVRQAIRKNMLDPNLPFGFGTKGTQLTRQNGYPYRSILILRKYRIVPVGWELAAEYIRNFGQVASLGELVNNFDNIDSPFYRLVDPNWVLKAPANYCKKQGAGPAILSINEIPGLDTPQRKTEDTFLIARDNEYCAEERGCIKEDDSGYCLQYGYCTLERPVWSFEGADGCEDWQDSCQSYGTRDGQTVSLLRSSVDYENCSASNVGCSWYCSEFSAPDGMWRCVDEDRVYNVCDQAGGCFVTRVVNSINYTCTIDYGAISCFDEGVQIFSGIPTAYGEADLYFDLDVKSCTAEEAGCSALIPVGGKPVNLFSNPSFEYGVDTVKGIVPVDEVTSPASVPIAGISLASGISSYTEALVGDYSLYMEDPELVQIPIDTGFGIANRTFSFSMYAKDALAVETCEGFRMSINGATVNELDSIPYDGDWERHAVVHSFGPNATGNSLVLWIDATAAPAADCFIDALMIEESAEPTDYQGYGAGSTYLKKPPANYDCEGYTTVVDDYDNEAACVTAIPPTSGKPYFWRDDIERCVLSGSEACADYGLYCRAQDVGCEFYSPADGTPTVPATVSPGDYCPRECVGYDTFKQEATYLEDPAFPIYFIPDTATQCTAKDVGCDEFTNLDKVAQGGEGLEYYSYVRQCVSEASSCATFYSWQGSEDTGYQLRAHSLLVDGAGDIEEVDPTAPYYYDQGTCLNLDDALANPQCKQLFDQEGDEHFVFLKNTFSCTDACRPYRKTDVATVEGATDAATCSADLGDWAPDVSTCYQCSKYGGTMVIEGTDLGNDGVAGNEACVFYIVPNEGITCEGKFAGCREYTGNAGQSVLTRMRERFERGINRWTNASLSSEATVVGGHSAKFPAFPAGISSAVGDYGSPCPLPEGCEVSVSGNYSCLVEETERYCGLAHDTFETNKLYNITFWAKHATPAAPDDDVEVRVNVDGNGTFLVDISEEWNRYSVGPVNIAAGMATSASLRFLLISATDPNAYLDNIEIRELSDTVYAVKNSWQIPASCDQDANGVESPQHMLGCSEYTDENGKALYLKSFESICREEVVGCEAFIDTFNSSLPFEETLGEGESTVYVPADRPIFFVNDPELSCTSTSKGCQALGKPTYDDRYQQSGFDTQYLINDPDDYYNIACQAPEVWCDAFSAGRGTDYFKNPLSQVCQYKEVDVSYGQGWYKFATTDGPPDCPTFTSEIGTKIPAFAVCEGGTSSGQGCLTDADCENGTCVRDNWAGLCPLEASSCTAYLDPTSDIETVLLYNPELEQDIDDDGAPDDWEEVVAVPPGYHRPEGIGASMAVLVDNVLNLEQAFNDLRPNTLYAISFWAKEFQGATYNPGDEAFMYIRAMEADTGDPPEKVSSYDNSLVLEDEDLGRFGRVSLRVDASAISDDYRRFSGRFYSGEATSGIVGVGSTAAAGFWLDDLALVEAGTYFKISDSVDYTSCNGRVNANAGCVLFNDRSAMSYSGYAQSLEDYYDSATPTSSGALDIAYLGKDADQSPNAAGAASTSCDNGAFPAGLCDSNSIVKTKRDRICKEWLYCQTTTTATLSEGAQEEEVCLEVGRCARMDNTGRCIDPVLVPQENVVFNKGSVGRLANITGYSKVGYDWGSDQIVGGYYPPENMEQVGSKVLVENGSFEFKDSKGKPFGWDTPEDDGFALGYFDTYSSIPEIQEALSTSRVTIPPDGKSFLGISATTPICQDGADDGQECVEDSDCAAPGICVARRRVELRRKVEAFPNVDYVVTGLINTNLLFNGAAVIEVAEFDPNGLLVQEYTPLLVLQPGNSWTELGNFWQTGQKTSSIGIRLSTTTDPAYYEDAGFGSTEQLHSGDAYFDSIRIEPALAMRNQSVDYAYSYDQRTLVPRTCRLYPHENAPSCEYFDDNDVFRRGWYGYCLEKDPQNPNACITWWPVDQILGDSMDATNYAQYQEQFPLYMCTGLHTYKTDYVGSHEIDMPDSMRCIKAGEYTWSDGYSKTLYKNEIDSITIDVDHFGMLAATTALFDDDKLYDRYHRVTLNEANGWQAVASQGMEEHCPDEEASYENLGRCLCRTDETPSGQDYDDHAYGFRASFSGTQNQKFSQIEIVRQVHSERAPTREKLSFTAEVAFHMTKRFCTDVTQVVSPFGENVAWTQRILPGSEYAMPETGWEFDTDYVPFGSVVPPEPQEDPARWDGLEDVRVCSQDYSIACAKDTDCAGAGSCSYTLNEGSQPLAWMLPDTGLEDPYQVRFSHPYAHISGEEKVPFKTCSETTQLCYYDSDCPRGETCSAETLVREGELDTFGEAMQEAQLVFAKAYGVWEFEFGQCTAESDRAGLTCVTDEDCALEPYVLYYPDIGPPGAASKTWWWPNETLSLTGVHHTCPDADATRNNNGYFFTTDIKEDDVSRIEVHAEGLDWDDWPIILTEDNDWSFVVDSGGNIIDSSVCTFEDVDDCSCGAGAVLGIGPLFAENGNLFGVDFASDGWYFGTTEGNVQVFVNEGVGECDLDSVNNYYEVSSGKIPWDTPTEICVADRADADYCAIAPQVGNVIINGVDTGTAEIVDRGYVTMTFNSYVDPEQLPLTGYSVNWGDGTTTSVSGLKSPPKSSEDSPHKLVRFFSYWDLFRRRNDPGTIIDCSIPDVCSITPTVQIYDNWGWCNGQGTATPYPDFGFNSKSDTDSDGINDCLDEVPTPGRIPWKESPVIISVIRE